MCFEADPRQQFDQPFQIERHRDEEGLHRELHFAKIATTSQAMPLLGFAKFALDFVTFLQPSLILGRFTQGYPDLFVGVLLFNAVIFQSNG